MKSKIKNALASALLLVPMIFQGASGIAQAAVVDNPTPYPSEVDVRIKKTATFDDNTELKSRSLEEGDPMVGVEFTMTDVTEKLKDLREEEPALTEAEIIAKLQTEKDDNGPTATTNADGIASFAKVATRNDNDEYKAYVFTETVSTGNTVKETSPLVLIFPTEDGHLELIDEKYTLTLKAKNQIAQENNKKITGSHDQVIGYLNGDKENTGAGFDAFVGKSFTYAIQALVPLEIAKSKNFTIIDTPDVGLKFDDASSLVIEGLKAGEDYIVETEDDKNGFTINFNLGTEKAPEFSAKVVAMAGKYLHISYDLAVTKDAPIDILLDNKFSISLDDKFVVNDKSQEGPRPVVGGKKFEKVDATNESKKLEGAKFVVYDKITKKYVAIADDGSVSYVAGIGDAKEYTSDSQGIVSISGLSYSKAEDGTVLHKYVLIETQAPNGYSIINAETEFDIKLDSTIGTLQPVTNKPNTFLPGTGAKGLVAMIALGLAVMTLGFVFFKKARA